MNEAIILEHVLKIIGALGLSYLVGSIPFGFLMCKLKGIDIREHGSGNLGATNVFRIIGKIPGVLTLLLDAGKGLLVVLCVAPFLLRSDPSFLMWRVLCGVCAIFGHNWTCFLSFKGGKGVATSAGVFLGIATVPLLLAICVWFVVFVVWKYVSLASIISAISFPIFLFLWKADLGVLLTGLLISIIGIWKHRSNIKRIIDSTEPKLIFGKKP